ncbi:helix-turn-helix domain-containing protein [Dactylosporangium sp. NPDC051541]|uniref:helix-turn-helix domain-containing protein n=1 Tax=Dactylosporangium sp. NPDC051541 TaxID=3363977 RepID=UPI00379F1B85
MDDPGPLGTFLASRRAQLQPPDVGLLTYGERRRVPGLRREEVAQLAGVGFSYYSRLEQGQSLNASPEVLDAIARALRLTETERRHLHALARPPRPAPARTRDTPERVTEETRHLLAAMGDAPALVLGRRTDVLAWNRCGHALFAGHLPFAAPDRAAGRPNMTGLVFLDPHLRDLYADWPAKARAVVGNLRLLVGRDPQDPALRRLVGTLSIESAEFARLWADHRVRDCDVAGYSMRHPLVGELTVTQQALPVPLAPGQRLVVATAPAGSDAAVSLSLLAHLVSAPPERPVGLDTTAGGGKKHV